MIPKIAHCIWIGGNPMPELVQKCMASFREHLPDYEIVLWDDARSKSILYLYPYALQAYQQGLYAFASDVIRLHVLYEYGGVYLDTDVELFGSLDPFLGHKFFSGFQDPRHAITAVMGAQKGNEFVAELLSEYDGREFLDKAGNPDFTTNTRLINQALIAKGIVLEDRDQEVGDGIAIYRQEVFSPFHPKYGGERTPHTVAVHHYSGSWVAHRRAYKILERRSRRRRRSVCVVLLLAVAGTLIFHN